MEEKRITMQDLWQLLQPSKTYDTRGRFEKCQSDWSSMSADQQKRVYQLLQAKKDQAKLNPNPYYALNDAMQEDEQQQARKPRAEPTNYNRRALPDKPVCIAKWNGSWGTYTVREAREYGMEVKRA